MNLNCTKTSFKYFKGLKKNILLLFTSLKGDYCLEDFMMHECNSTLSSNSLTLKAGNFNLNIMQLPRFKVVAKNRAGNLAYSFVWSKKQ